MAKKKPGEFNMAEEIRRLLKASPNMTGREVEATLKKKFPRQKINGNSCGVAFSNARKALGIARTGGRRRAGIIDLETLTAAKKFLAACGGDRETATKALDQLDELQV